MGYSGCRLIHLVGGIDGFSVNSILLSMNLSVLLYIIRRIHAEKLIELFPEVFNIPDTDGVSCFLDTVVCIYK